MRMASRISACYSYNGLGFGESKMRDGLLVGLIRYNSCLSCRWVIFFHVKNICLLTSFCSDDNSRLYLKSTNTAPRKASLSIIIRFPACRVPWGILRKRTFHFDHTRIPLAPILQGDRLPFETDLEDVE